MSRPLIFLHQYFAPELAGSAQQLTDLTLGLKDKGYSIQVVTGQPSYSSKGKLPSKENFQGIQIYRVPKIQVSREGALGRIVSAVSFFLTAFLKLVGMDRQALLVIGSDPPFLCLLGWFFRGVRGQRYVLIVSDIYPDVAVALGELSLKGWMTRILEWSNGLSYRGAQKIVVLGEKMRKHLRSKYLKGDDADKIHVIHNWADGDWIHPLPKEKNRFCREKNLLGKLVILFSGNLGQIYDFEEALKIATILREERTIEFLFIGEGPFRGRLIEEVRKRGLGNLRFLSYQPFEGLPESLTAGDVAILPLKRESAGLCVPGKLYYALAGGVPLLVVGPKECEPSEIVQTHGCGWFVESGRPEEAAEILRRLSHEPSLLEEKRKKARGCFEACFTRERAIQQYEEVFKKGTGS